MTVKDWGVETLGGNQTVHLTGMLRDMHRKSHDDLGGGPPVLYISDSEVPRFFSSESRPLEFCIKDLREKIVTIEAVRNDSPKQSGNGRK